MGLNCIIINRVKYSKYKFYHCNLRLKCSNKFIRRKKNQLPYKTNEYGSGLNKNTK